MTVPDLNSYQGLGGLHGGYWQASSQAPNSALNSAYSAYMGATGTQATAAIPDPIEDAGIRAGEIEAVRVWLLKNGYLYSMFANHVWSPGQVEVGTPNDGTGIHAFKTVGQAMANYGHSGSEPEPLIIGKVLLWGDVIEHERGYRAEFASIASLDEMVPAPREPRKKLFRPIEVDRRLDLVRAKYLCLKET